MTRWAKTGWTWVAILVGVGLVELALVKAHLPTLSQFVQRSNNWWVKGIVIAVMTIFTLHLVWPQQEQAPDPVPIEYSDEEG